MATNERMSSIKQNPTMKGDKHMNTNRQAATIVPSPRKIAIAAGVFYLITHVVLEMVLDRKSDLAAIEKGALL